MQLVMQTGKQGGKLGEGALLDVEDWLSLALADRELFAKLTSRGFWLAAVGCTLDGPVSGPKGDVARFSLLSLALKIRREQRAEGAWAKELLCNYRASYSAGGGGVCGDAAAEKKQEATFYTVPWLLDKVVEARSADAPLLPLIVCLSDEASSAFFCRR